MKLGVQVRAEVTVQHKAQSEVLLPKQLIEQLQEQLTMQLIL